MKKEVSELCTANYNLKIKVCTACRETKKLGDFHRHKNGKYGDLIARGEKPARKNATLIRKLQEGGARLPTDRWGVLMS